MPEWCYNIYNPRKCFLVLNGQKPKRSNVLSTNKLTLAQETAHKKKVQEFDEIAKRFPRSAGRNHKEIFGHYDFQRSGVEIIGSRTFGSSND